MLWCDLWNDDDAIVRLSTQSDPARGVEGDDVTTRADGTAELIVASGIAYLVRSRSPDQQAGDVELQTEALQPGEDRPVLLELPTAYDLLFRGRVVDVENGIQLAGARVALVKRKGRGSIELSAVQAADDGTFELRAPSWLRVAARIELDGYSPMIVDLRSGHEDLASERIVRLRRSAALAIRIRGMETHPGAAGHIGIQGFLDDPEDGPPGTDLDWTAWNLQTDPNGAAEIAGLPAGKQLSIVVDVEQGGHRIHHGTETLVLEPRESRLLEFTLGSRRLEGTVVDDRGAAVPELDLWAFPGDYDGASLAGESWMSASTSAISDDAGRFVMDGLTPGVWSIGPPGGERRNEPRPDGIAAVLTRVTVPETGTASVELRVFRDHYIRGRVLDVDGKAPQECRVSCRVGPVGELECEPDEDGAFRLGPFAPGSYALYARPYSNADDEWLAFRRDSEKVLAKTGDEDVVLRLQPAGTLEGRVEIEGDEEESGGWFQVSGETQHGWVQGGMETDGTFSVQSLAPGTYSITVVTTNDLVATASGIQVRPLETTSGIVLHPVAGARIEIDFDPDPVPEESTGRAPGHWIAVACNGIPTAEEWAQGDIELVVPAGDLLLRIRRLDWVSGITTEVLELEQSFSLAVGEEKSVVFRP